MSQGRLENSTHAAVRLHKVRHLGAKTLLVLTGHRRARYNLSLRERKTKKKNNTHTGHFRKSQENI